MRYWSASSRSTAASVEFAAHCPLQSKRGRSKIAKLIVPEVNAREAAMVGGVKSIR